MIGTKDYSAALGKSIRQAAVYLVGVEQPPILPLDGKSGENPGPIGPRIDADSVRPLSDAVRDRVAMDDDQAMVAIVEQERLADPAKVGLVLVLDRYPWPDSGMNEEIVAKPAGVGKALEESDVLGWNGTPHDRNRLVIAEVCEL